MDTAHGIVSSSTAIEAYRSALGADYRLIAGYTACLVLLNALGWRCFSQPRTRRIAGMFAITTLVAGALDVIENLAVTQGLDGLVHPVPSEEGWWRLAAAADVLKLALLVPTALAAAVTLLVVVRRVLPRRRRARCAVVRGSYSVGDPGGDLPYLPREVAADRSAGRVGVCVSGGGIRSACVTLGALQKLRPAGWLRDDGYLFSVSGGGYTAGALRLAMQPARGQRGSPCADRMPPLYNEDTPELRHLRDHGNYIARGAVEWIVALGAVLAHLLYSLFLLAAASVAGGLLLGLLYRHVPVTGPGLGGALPGAARSTVRATWLLGALLALAVLCWLVAGTVEGALGVPSRWWRGVAWSAAGLALLVAVITVLVPALVALVAPEVGAGLLKAIGGGSAVLTVLSTLVTMASKRRPRTRAPGRQARQVSSCGSW